METLTDKQQKALLALMSSPTISAAARQAGCSERSLYLWLRDPTFAAEYRQQRQEALGHATSLLMKAASTFVAVLLKVATNEEASDAARVSAATRGLEMAYRGSELESVVERLDALEQQLAVLPAGKAVTGNGRH